MQLDPGDFERLANGDLNGERAVNTGDTTMTTIDDPLSKAMILELQTIERQLLDVQEKLKAVPGWVRTIRSGLTPLRSSIRS